MADSSARERWNQIDPALRACVEEVMGPPPPTELRDVPKKESLPYAITDCISTRMLYPQLLAKVKEAGLERVLDIDMAVVPLCARIQSVGMLIDKARFATLSADLQQRMDKLDTEMYQLVGRFDPGSYDQVSELLFGRLELQNKTKARLKRTAKTNRFKADDVALKAVKHLHPVVPLLLERAEYFKLKNTFADVLPTLAGPDGRVRTHIRLTRVPSGRAAEHNPNLQQIPTKSEVAKQVRKCFVAPDGYVLGSMDLSAIELRVPASMSGDPLLCQIFHQGRDPHTEAAARIFGKKPEDVNRETERYPIKMLSFLILYGGSALGLSEQLIAVGLTTYDEKRCQGLIDDWFKVYKGVHQMVLDTHSFARLHGYVLDLFGRRIWVPQVRSTVSRISAEGLRLSVNARIQGTAAGILKLAMAKCWRVLKDFWAEGRKLEIIQTVHDELIYELPLGLEQEVEARFKPCFENAVKLKVPIQAGCSFAPDWGSFEK